MSTIFGATAAIQTSDVHLQTAFRHELGLPYNFYPEVWKAADPNPEGDFIPTPLAPGQLDRIHWKDTGEIVLQNAFRLGLTSTVRETLLEYCNKMGITDIMRHVTVEDNGLEAGTETDMNINGYHWYLQRPEKKWFSNLHWLSPGDMAAHDNYLQALNVAGFSDMLKGIGEYLGLDHLCVFHVTFIATSQSTRGYIHTDVSNTGVRTFNVIIPLIKASNSPPELDIQENEENGRIGRYGYEYDVAGLMGDDVSTLFVGDDVVICLFVNVLILIHPPLLSILFSRGTGRPPSITGCRRRCDLRQQCTLPKSRKTTSIRSWRITRRRSRRRTTRTCSCHGRDGTGSATTRPRNCLRRRGITSSWQKNKGNNFQYVQYKLE